MTIDTIDPGQPDPNDPAGQGDDQLRDFKQDIVDTFPQAPTATPTDPWDIPLEVGPRAVNDVINKATTADLAATDAQVLANTIQIGINTAAISALAVPNPTNVDHSTVSIISGQGISGGGDITVSRTLNVGQGSGIRVNSNDVALGIDLLATKATPDAGDFFALFDGTHKKATLASMISAALGVTPGPTGKIVFGAVTIQWGTDTISGNTTTSVFGTAFSGVPYVVVPVDAVLGDTGGADTAPAYNTLPTASQVVWTTQSGHDSIFYIAIGPT